MSTIGIASLYIPDFAPLWIALLVSGIFAYPIYRLLLQLKSRQIISQFVQEHQKKQGTPTMGGLITMVGAEDVADNLPSGLSTGRKRAVAIARALASQPEVVLYDEPTTMVDPLTAHLLGDLIKKLKYQLKLTSIVVTHDMALAKKIADRIVFLHEGQVVFFDTPTKMEQSELEIVREFLALDSLDLEYWRGGQSPSPPMPQE